MTSKTIDADVEFNRENIALARSKKLVYSWLPSEGGDSLGDEKAEDSEDEYEGDTAGVGGKEPDADEVLGPKRPSASISKLMEQMVGKHAAKQLKRGPHGSPALQHKATKPLNRSDSSAKAKQDPTDDSDDSQGRAGMFKSKAGSKRGRTTEGAKPTAVDEGATEGGRGPAKRRAGGSSYLDQVLGQKGSRKKGK